MSLNRVEKVALVGTSALAQRENLRRRERRLLIAATFNFPAPERAMLIDMARDRIWYQIRELDFACHLEELEQDWPDGLPAHP